MRLIDADELERRLKDLDSKTFCDRQQAVNACIAETSVMPTVDAEPVIRCKDCKHDIGKRFNSDEGRCIGCSIIQKYVKENDFCCWAEPKEV